MYEVVTGKTPYEDNIPIFQFFSKVVNKKYRPSFNNIPVKTSIRNLIEQCWSPNPKKRPTFEEIFEKLTEKTDFYLDNVDMNAVSKYVKKISGKTLNNSKQNSNGLLLRRNDCIDLKIVVMGSQQSNKASVINCYCNFGFRNESTSKIGAGFFTHSLEIDGQEVCLMLWDTAGESRFKSVAPSLQRGSNGLVLVYDVTDKSSFDDLEYYLSVFMDVNDMSKYPIMPVLLLSNKIDLGACEFADEVEKWKNKYNIVHTAFISAKTGEGVNESFHDFIMDLIETPCCENDQQIVLTENSSRITNFC